MSEKKTTHLQMIQEIITRMGNNSFAIKGWTIGVMVAVYAFAGSNVKNALVITLIPMFVFAALDAKYLLIERKYRVLYDKVRQQQEEDVNFDMSIKNMYISIDDAVKFDVLRVFFSWSILPFYLICVGVTLFLYLFT